MTTTNYHLGETGSAPVGSSLHFEPGSFTQRGDQYWCFITPFDCIQGSNGLENADGTPADITAHAIQVTAEARDAYIKALKKTQV